MIEFGGLAFNFDLDESEQVDVLPVAGCDERQQFVGDIAALGAQFLDAIT
ncbi:MULTISPECIES: hypothetical protein [unclassified Nonomuraea]